MRVLTEQVISVRLCGFLCVHLELSDSRRLAEDLWKLTGVSGHAEERFWNDYCYLWVCWCQQTVLGERLLLALGS